MFKNYFTTAIKNLLKNKLFSAINIAGLAIGVAACLLIALYVRNETTYDQHWSKGERLYRVTTTRFWDDGHTSTNARNPLLLVPALRRYFAEEIEAAVRMQPYTREIQTGASVFQSRVMEVDSPEVAAMFDFEVLAGNLESTLRDPGGIALSAELAERFYGCLDVASEILSLRISENDVRDLRIGAVYRLPAGNTILRDGLLQLPAMMAMDIASKPDQWDIIIPFNYVLLKPGVNSEDINARMREFINQNVDISDFEQAGPGVPPSDKISFTLQNIADVYLNSPFDGYGGRGNKIVVLAFSAIARWIKGMQKGIEEGRQKGWEEGRQEESVTFLLRLLRRRFGELPAWVMPRLQAAEPELLEAWGERLLEADSLETLFKD